MLTSAHKYAAAVVGLAAALLVGPLRAQELQLGTTGASSDAPFFIAHKKGYFSEEGLNVKIIRFDSAAKMIPSGA